MDREPLHDYPADIADQVRLLKSGLSLRHQHLYAYNASFRAAVATLANLLPLWVDGLAVQADFETADIQRRMVEMMTAPNPNPPPLT